MSTIGETRAAALFGDMIVWDAHSGFMPDPVADLNNLRLWRDVGVGHLSVDVGFDLMPWHDTVRTLSAFRSWVLAHPDHYALAGTAADVRAARAAGRMAISFDIEGANALNGRVDMVETYHALGVRQILLAYNRNTAAGGGCHDTDSGLTGFGREVVAEMNRLGMFVDVTHCGLRTSMDVMEYSSRPVIFSHSNAAALEPHGRNIVDQQARACAQTGGVVGAVGVSLFLGGRADAARYADHIEHLLAVAGPGNVGIGLDYGFEVEMEGLDEVVARNPDYWPASEGYGAAAISFVEPRQLVRVADVLLDRGHDEEVVRGVFGDNFLRLAERVWA